MVALDGPPAVMFTTSSNSWIVPMVEVMDVNNMTSFNCGMTT